MASTVSLSSSQSHDPFAYCAGLAKESGGFFEHLPHHALGLIRRSEEMLVVSFDNILSLREKEKRLPWADALCAAEGWSSMGVMIKRRDWFRHADLLEAFDALSRDGLFDRYRKVAFYGTSMGGYGALAFSRAVPGATVLALSPQTSLDPARAPFETRYARARDIGDWAHPLYADGAEGLSSAGRVYVIYDPNLRLDRQHVERIAPASHIRRMHLYGMGHKLAPLMNRMKMLKTVSTTALQGRLDEAAFYKLFRARRSTFPCLEHSLITAAQKGHTHLALRAVNCALRKEKYWRLRKLRYDLKAYEADPGAKAEA